MIRINGDGRIGIGLTRSSNMGAWLHADKNDTDFSGLNNDMFIVDDTSKNVTWVARRSRRSACGRGGA